MSQPPLPTPSEIVQDILASIEKYHDEQKKTSRFFLSFETLKAYSGRTNLGDSIINEIQSAFIEDATTDWHMAWRAAYDRRQGFLLFKDDFIDSWDELF